MRRIQEIFKQPRAVFPVVHACEERQAREAAELAVACGADGVFFINQGSSLTGHLGAHATFEAALAFATAHPDAWVGISLLGFDPFMTLCAVLARPGIRMIWTDDCIREPWRPHAASWNGLYFAGVAFKGQEQVPEAQWGLAARTAARLDVDVITTSGPCTGSAPDPLKPAIMRAAVPDHPIAIASGITPENVRSFPHADAFLVATGIEQSFGYFDEARLRRLVELVHTV